ncbi:MAG: type II toxin-antitoxin system Phd/YefM family antitoxin [Microbacteriaceae bacterium]
MQTTTKRELNQNTAAVLDRVTDADDVVVTERGKPRWRVSTVRNQEAPLARLEREGRYTPPASTPAPWPSHPGGPPYTGDHVDALLDEMRGDH